MPDTLSRRPPRRFWGWGQADAALDAREQANLRFMLDQLGAVQGEAAPPRVEDFALRAPRISPPAALAAHVLQPATGPAQPQLRQELRRPARACGCATCPSRRTGWPIPDDEQAIVDLLDWAARHNVAVIPYGGGSSVCGGVEPAVGASYAGTVSLDLERLNRVLEVDRSSRAARIQAGALGPELEAQLQAARPDAAALPAELRVLHARRLDRHPRRRPLRHAAHPHRRLRRKHAPGHARPA